MDEKVDQQNPNSAEQEVNMALKDNFEKILEEQSIFFIWNIH